MPGDGPAALNGDENMTSKKDTSKAAKVKPKNNAETTKEYAIAMCDALPRQYDPYCLLAALAMVQETALRTMRMEADE